MPSATDRPTRAPAQPMSTAPLAARTGLSAWVGLSLPLLFILLWSSGYVAGRLALPHTGPLTLLTLRFGLAALVLLLLAGLSRAPWPRGAMAWGHLAVAGLLLQVLHFAGIYYGLRLGLSAGVAGLLIGLMPLATALGAHLWLAEQLTRRQALGLAGGLFGVALVVAGQPMDAAGGWAAHAAALLGLFGLVLGTLYQKRYCSGMDLRSGAGVQMLVSTLAVAAWAWPAEHFALRWSGELLGAALWLSLVNSIGAFSLMFLMMRQGQAAQVARLFFLIPGVSALLGFAVLGERLGLLALGGFALSAGAVLLGSTLGKSR